MKKSLMRYISTLLTVVILLGVLVPAGAEIEIKPKGANVISTEDNGYMVTSTIQTETMFHRMKGPGEQVIPLSALTLKAPPLVVGLGMDQEIKGKALKIDNVGVENMSYADSTIVMSETEDTVGYTDFKGQGYTVCHVVRVTVADPSQIRTAMSYDDYDTRRHARAQRMAEACNAVAAVDGDYFKNAAERGFVFRQGVFYRDLAGGERDALLIDSAGDFHAIYRATGESIRAAMDALPDGVEAVNVMNFGPVLVDHGVVADIARSTAGTAENQQDMFEYRYRMPRAAIVQLGKLEYAIVECDAENTKGATGMTMQTFADYIHEIFPDCLMAYNLDGGNSTNVVIPRTGYNPTYGNREIQFTRIHYYPESREICDMIYFASLED